MFNQLLQPGESRDYAHSGRVVRIDNGTRVRVQTDRGEVADLYERETAEFQPFSRITLTNIADNAETIQARAGTARIVSSGDDALVTVGNAVDIAALPPVTVQSMPAVNVGIVAPTPLNESPDTPDIPVTAGQTVLIHDPAVYSCETVEVYPHEANTLNLRVWPGGDGLTVQGGFLAPGGAAEYSGALKIWVHNSGAQDQTVCLAKLKRV